MKLVASVSKIDGEDMKKNQSIARVYVRLTAFWGNDDEESTIKVSRRRWKEIQEGANYSTSAWSWFEGVRSTVFWDFADGNVSIDGFDGMQCIAELPVSELIVHTTT